MNKPTAAELVAWMGRGAPAATALTSALDMAVEYVEQRVGKLADRETNTAMCAEAIFIIAAHVYGARQNPSAQSAMYGSGDYTPGPAGYLIPNRAKSLLDALWADDPSSIGIG